MKAALYARVSTHDQSTDIQVRELAAYCQRQGWDLTHTYTDVISGAKAKRVDGAAKLDHEAAV